MKSRQFWIKLLITIITLAWFFSRVRLTPLIERLSHVNWWIIIAGFLISSTWVLPSAERWKRLACVCGYPIGLGTATRLYIIGCFFNVFLPTGTGGDVFRGYLGAKEKGYPLGAIWGIIFVERVIGFAVSLGLVFITGLLFFSKVPQLKSVLFSSGALLLGITVGGLFLSSIKFRNLIKPAAKKVTRRSFREGAADLLRVVMICRQHPNTMIFAVYLTLINQVSQIIGGFLISLAILDFNASLLIFFVVIPLSFVSLLLPSIGGYGVREAGFVVFFGWFGIHHELAACFGILRLLYLWCFAMAGGVLYLFGKTGKKERKNSDLVQTT
jgi:uncharacterized protein (TIRG00374 family)